MGIFKGFNSKLAETNERPSIESVAAVLQKIGQTSHVGWGKTYLDKSGFPDRSQHGCREQRFGGFNHVN